jgi:hypothetical protein
MNAREAGRKGGYANRRYPAVAVGQKYGCWRVTKLLGRGHKGRADMRVQLTCTCGRTSEVYEFLVRDRNITCKHTRKV